jgi:hypothetical protein
VQISRVLHRVGWVGLALVAALLLFAVAADLIADRDSGLPSDPARVGQQQVRLRSCPCQRFARHSRELICAMDTQFFAGLVEGIGGWSRVDLVPGPTLG